MTFTCIIPFLNERDRILKVLDVVVKINGIDEIICVDDGSTDKAAQLIKEHFPHITIFSNKENLGKAEAIKIGLQHAKGTNILLLDADLKGLQVKELENAVATVKMDTTIDMIILRRVKSPFIVKVRLYDVLLCGQRIVKKDDLLKVLSIYHPKGYELEVALNQYMLKKKKNVFWMPISFINTESTKKIGFIPGIYKIIRMPTELFIGYVGVPDTVKQLLFFCRKEYRNGIITSDVK
jgi:glycosyltransferase involved in cell wall biosynthesis